MKDYSNHKYHYLFEYIEDGCKRMNEKRDFAGYLLSMERAASIREMISIYDNIYTLLAVLILGTHKLPKEWYNKATLGIGNNWLFSNLADFFNYNVLRVFKAYKNPPIQFYYYCLANLREEGFAKLVDSEIILNVNTDKFKELKTIMSARVQQYSRRTSTKLFDIDYNSMELLQFKNASKILAHYNRHFDVAETLFAKKYDIKYEELPEQYLRDLEELKKREEERARERKRLKEEASSSSYSHYYVPSSGVLDDAGELLGSLILGLPFAFLGGIIGSMKKK